MNENTLSSKDAYRLLLKEYPDVMNIEQMCEVLGGSTKTGYKLLKDKKIECLRSVDLIAFPKPMFFTT